VASSLLRLFHQGDGGCLQSWDWGWRVFFHHDDGHLDSPQELSTGTELGRAEFNPEIASTQLSRRLLTLGIGLSMLVAGGGLLQALASGLGPHPNTRLAIGLSLLALNSGVLSFRARVLRLLRDWRWAILLFAALQTAVVSLDGLPGSPYFASCLIPIGVAMLAGPSLSWLCAGVVDGVLVLAMVGPGPSPSFTGGAGTTIGALVAPPISALALTTLTRAYERTTVWISERMAESAISQPTEVLTQRPAADPPGDEPPAPWAELTPAEIRVAGGLARWGKTALIAKERELSTSTIDNQLAEALKKTGSRTRSQLAGLTAHPAWPGAFDDD
jgi:DNA-binding CsgD family transcriptional regulator